MNKWDSRFLSLASHVSTWSKDPSTQTGAVITTADYRIVSVGVNEFPRGIEDSAERLNDRETKYALIIHCEINAVLFARGSVQGCTLYTWPFSSCTRCAVHMIQAGIVRHVAPECPPDKWARWGDDLKRAIKVYEEAGIVVNII